MTTAERNPERPERLYEDALRAMRDARTREDFTGAEATFRLLGAFRDAPALADQCRERADICRKEGVYAAARWQMERGSVSGYLSAVQLFASIPGWKDADALAAASREGIERLRLRGERAQAAAQRRAKILRRCAVVLAALIPLCAAAALLWRQTLAPRLQYKRALALMEQEEYLPAWGLLEKLELPGCDARRGEIREALLRRPDVGSRVLFGSCEQDGREDNGLEDILWRVLERDGDRCLLLSEYALGSRPFERPGRKVTWAECQLRAWLNGAFLSDAFSGAERERILAADVPADRNPSTAADPGAPTRDRLFLLSAEEAYRYLPTEEERQCSATPWAKRHSAFQSSESGYTWWWLRTPGQMTNFAALVLDSGAVLEPGFHVAYTYITVRPALWIDLGGSGV